MERGERRFGSWARRWTVSEFRSEGARRCQVFRGGILRHCHGRQRLRDTVDLVVVARLDVSQDAPYGVRSTIPSIPWLSVLWRGVLRRLAFGVGL